MAFFRKNAPKIQEQTDRRPLQMETLKTSLREEKYHHIQGLLKGLGRLSEEERNAMEADVISSLPRTLEKKRIGVFLELATAIATDDNLPVLKPLFIKATELAAREGWSEQVKALIQLGKLKQNDLDQIREAFISGSKLLQELVWPNRPTDLHAFISPEKAKSDKKGGS